VSDKELWQSLATGRNVAAAVSDLDFAAWLEGRLSEDEAAHVEAAIHADPDMRRAALELADILGKALPAAPARMAVRARALVGVEKTASRDWFAPLVAIFGAGLAIERGAMAGIAIVVAAVGFLMGGGLGDSYAQTKRPTVSASHSFGVDTTNQLNDLFTDNG
jgi:anti-sigma factor RsiW